MKKKAIIKICILFPLTHLGNGKDCFSQNMVNNPSFEESFSCPVYEDQLDISKYWFSPTDGSPDYFNKCATGGIRSKKIQFGIPFNADGYQMARTGIAYAGVINFNDEHFTYREFIGTRLKEPLVAEKTYKFGMYISLADSSRYYNNRFGFCFSKEKTLPSESKNNEYNVYFCNNSLLIVNDSIGKDTANWHLVQGEYLANGGEEYLIIGLCKGNITKKQYRHVKNKNRTHVGNRPYAYYYIDDVFVEEKK
jgi:OmpA-OmpF porin, OOP family